MWGACLGAQAVGPHSMVGPELIPALPAPGLRDLVCAGTKLCLAISGAAPWESMTSTYTALCLHPLVGNIFCRLLLGNIFFLFLYLY